MPTNCLLILANIIFYLSFWFQIILNFKIKSTKGLSPCFIFMGLTSNLCYLAYAMGTNLPVIYKIMGNLNLLNFLILIAQQIYYSQKVKYIFYFYFLYLVLFFSFTFLSIKYFSFFINYLGWIPIFISLYKKVPQILKIQKTRSVEGFSFLFILVNLFGYILETIGVLLLNLPAQVLYNDFKGLFVNIIFLGQFWVFRKF